MFASSSICKILDWLVVTATRSASLRLSLVANESLCAATIFSQYSASPLRMACVSRNGYACSTRPKTTSRASS
jgi:hypothetical protein